MDNYMNIGYVNNTNADTTFDRVAEVIGWITFAVGLPAIGLALYTMKNLVKGPNPVPVHVISLLVSDIFSFIGRPQAATGSILSADTATLIFYFGIKRTVGVLAVILTNYTVLFLPFILNILLKSLKEEVRYLGLIANLLLYLSPLMDPFLYIFMTKGPREVVEALLCCKNNLSRQPEETQTVVTLSETVTETRL
ncbi:unnamed protein product [Coregonus sp. 'balchen']|nr:unnamed protein product [Coregonus sp. 'balchen']